MVTKKEVWIPPLAGGLESWLLQDVNGFNSVFDLEDTPPFFIRVAAHLGAIGRNYYTSDNYRPHVGVVGKGICTLKLLPKPRER